MIFLKKNASLFEVEKLIMVKVSFAPISVMYIEDDGALF